MDGYIAMSAQCRTTDGRTVGMTAPILPELREDGPVLRAFILDTLRRAAAHGNPPGYLYEEALIIKFPEDIAGISQDAQGV